MGVKQCCVLASQSILVDAKRTKTMEHWELGYHSNRKCNKVDNEVGKIVLRVETGQYEPKWEWEQGHTRNRNRRTPLCKSGNGNKSYTPSINRCMGTETGPFTHS